ncbi:hypothetical protein HQ535_02665 [bacterium]|nr:hypothetical protein [bacterium]
MRPEPGNTVWGAIFSVGKNDLAALDANETSKGRQAIKAKAMDREGRRHDVVVHVSAGEPNGEYSPERSVLEAMVSGGRHWKLPAGWVASLEEHLEDL